MDLALATVTFSMEALSSGAAKSCFKFIVSSFKATGSQAR